MPALSAAALIDAATGRFLRVSESLCSLSGYAAPDPLALDLLDLLPQAARPAGGVAAGGESETRLRRKDGARRDVRAAVHAFGDDQGRERFGARRPRES